MQDTAAEQSVMEVLFDQLEELIVTIVEEVRERPGVAVAILAGVVGVVMGSILAGRSRRRGRLAPVARRARDVTDTGELLGLGLRLLQNPIARAALIGMLRRRFAM